MTTWILLLLLATGAGALLIVLGLTLFPKRTATQDGQTQDGQSLGSYAAELIMFDDKEPRNHGLVAESTVDSFELGATIIGDLLQ